MKNQAQMKQELELWEMGETANTRYQTYASAQQRTYHSQEPAPYTQPIPRQNQQPDIQPMFDIQKSMARTAPQRRQNMKQRRPHTTANATPRQNIAPQRTSQARRHATPGRNAELHQNTIPQQRAHTRQGKQTQQPPYLQHSPQARRNPYAPPVRSGNGTRQNPRAQQNTYTIQPPYVQSPVRTQQNSAIRQTANPYKHTQVHTAKTAAQGPNSRTKTKQPRKRAVQTMPRTTAPARKKQVFYQQLAILMILVIPVAIFLWTKLAKPAAPAVATPKVSQKVVDQADTAENTLNRPPIEEDFLSISEYNRPGTKLASVKNIFVHYTANPGTSAAQNRSYFENLSQTHERSASAHFIIGCEGEIIQCIPLDEEAYAVRGRNNDSISIECCYRSEDGKFTQATYDSLISMLVWLTGQYNLESTDILRHYDCGGKRCPLYYVEHEDAWEQLLDDVANNQSENNNTTL